MSVTFTIKNVPDDLAQALRRRAAANHRSLQGELLAILEDSLHSAQPVRLSEFLERVRASGLKTGDEATRMIREDRDAR